MDLPRELSDPLSRAADRLRPFASRVVWQPEIGSTNDAAATLADSGAPEGTLVIADAQSAGRGRLGRSWVSPPGAGIYVSAVLRPPPEAVRLITLAAGVAVAEGIEAATGLPVHVKWPNDVIVNGPTGPASARKLAGILAEAGNQGDAAWVVIGIGINVLPAAYPPDVAARATSLEVELGRGADRGEVLAECLAALAGRYRDLRAGRGADVVAAWRARAASTFGRPVEWDSGPAVLRGTAHDVDADGGLLVRTPSGVTRIVSGEVRWI